MQSAACHGTNKGTAHNVPQLKCTQNYFIIRTNVAQWQLQPPSSSRPCVPACHMSHATSPLGTVVLGPAPCTWVECDARPSSCQRDFGGPVSMSKRGSTTRQHSSHNICAREGPPAPPRFQSAHPALYHVICYPTIYNCIKTHTRTQRLFPATARPSMSTGLPPPPLNPTTVRYNFMLCLTFCSFFGLGLMLWVLLLLVLI